MTLQARERLLAREVDVRLLPGARNVVRRGLDVRPGHSVVLVVEAKEPFEELGAAFLREAEEAGGDCFVYLVSAQHTASEVLVSRLLARLQDADASLLVASTSGLPAAFRRQLIEAGGARRRHGHMLDASAAVLMQSLRADPEEVQQLGARLAARLDGARTIHVATTTGTDVRVRLEPGRPWHHESGMLRKPGWMCLPAGEVCVSPASVDGVVVPDAMWTCSGPELPRTARVRLHLEAGRLVRAETRDKELEAALDACLDADANGRRVGALGLGTNVAVLTPIGALLQDQKMPGVHLALGHPFGERTGGTWTSSVELALLVHRPDVSVDGATVMVRGRYARAILG